MTQIIMQIWHRVIDMAIFTFYSVLTLTKNLILWVTYMCDTIAYGEEKPLTEFTRNSFSKIFKVFFKVKA